MASARETITIDAPAATVLEILSDPQEAARWFPLPVDLIDPPPAPVSEGDAMLSRGELAGQAVEFEVAIEQVREDGVALIAAGPLDCRIDSEVRADGEATDLTVELTVESPGGVAGGVMATAAKPLVAPWLRQALECIRDRAEAR